MLKMSADFKDFLKLLNEKGVEYLLIGAYAVSYHGYVRSTGDLDIWVKLDQTNAELTAAALDDFGYAPADVSLPYLTQADRVLRMGMPPFRLEVSTGIDGVEFDECYRKRQIVELDGIPVSVIGLAELLLNKKAAGRLKDLADVEELEKRNPQTPSS